ncbi:DNA repair protein RadA [candidate division KSB1 bacterium]|nr:DNA repair protein RadA [candidate division KSB1 bacterium]
MAAKVKSSYICQTCGYASPRWMGKCPDCGAWNTLVEEIIPAKNAKRRTTLAMQTVKLLGLDELPVDQEPRISSGYKELDRVLGGGLVKGGVVLIGGPPGIGKSTLLLQVSGMLASKGLNVLYISGEESLSQIKLRAERLEMSAPTLKILSESSLEIITGVIEATQPGFVVMDSIQTVFSSDFESLPGHIGQVRYCGHTLTKLAKDKQIPMFLVGQVTKDGSLAGPRVLEHLVDCLLLFEGDDQHVYRLLRTAKNRFGSTNEVGIFEMGSKGVTEVKNPSAHLIGNQAHTASGTCIAVSLEGTRPLLVEIQALVTPSSYGTPQRNATGFDARRLAMLLAVLEKRLGLHFGTQDVFINAAGGLRLIDPGVDLAVALAIVSSLKEQVLPPKTAVFGEIGLSGEVRSVTQSAQRISEVSRLGFDSVILPVDTAKGIKRPDKLNLLSASTVQNAVDQLSNSSNFRGSRI